MGKRGRKSEGELSVVAAIGPEGVTSLRRAEAPAELTPDQAAEWRRIVNRLPAEWFPAETWPLLADYCRHILSSRRIAAMIETLEAEMEKASVEEGRSSVILSAAKAYDRLLRMADRESRAMTALARSLRLTLQAQYSNRKTRPPPTGKKPWDLRA